MTKCPRCGIYFDSQLGVCDCGYKPGPAAPLAARKSYSQRFNATSTLSKAMITAGAMLGLLLITMIAVWPSTNNSQIPAEGTRPAVIPAPSENPKQIKTVVVRQDAMGYQDSDLTLDALKRLEQELTAGTLQRARENVAAQGLPATDVDPNMITSRSWFMETGGRKFAIVDMHAGPSRIKTVAAFQNNEFVHVSCIDPSGTNVPIFSGPCAVKIREVFGVALPTD